MHIMKNSRRISIVTLLLAFVATAQAQVSNGPAAYYPLDGNVNDASGHNLNGTAYNGVTYVPHLSDLGAHLSGASQFISLPETIPSGTDLTVAFWLKTSASTLNTFPFGLFLVSRDMGFENYDWNICLAQGRKIEFHTGTPGNDYLILYTPNDIVSNEWVHVTCVADSVGAAKRIYLNGQLAASGSWTPHAFANSGIPIFLGSATAGQELHPYLPGDMDEVRIYGRALSGTEVLAVYTNNPAGTPVPTNGLLAYYPLQGDVNDASGHNQNGTAHNGVTYVSRVSGLAAHLSGDSQYISLPTTIPSASDLTVAFWLRTGASTPNTFPFGLFVVSRDIGYANYDWNICLAQGRKIEFHTGTPGNDYLILYTPNDIVSNEWVHVTCVADSTGASKRIYLNAQLAASGSWSPHPFANTGVPIFLGSATAGQELHPYLPGDMDEVRIYNRALAADEIQAIYGTNDLSPIFPSILTQPASQTITVGNHVGFTVQANGTSPLSYQWRLNGTNITGATASSFGIDNVQLTNSGNYSVLVTNSVGSVLSSNALLTVVPPPSAFRIANVNASSGGTVTVPVMLTANGLENALSFSLSFNTSRLAYVSALLANGAGGTLFLNESQTANGRLGVALALPANNTFPVGTQELVEVTFNVAITTTNTSVTNIFGDQPIVRQVSDAQGHTLTATYANGSVAIAAADFEADVSPGPSGDKTVTVTDWVMIGRYAARLDTPATGSIFQRADCAPRANLGDGRISITDWVQAGRYVAGLDPLTIAGGPTSQSALVRSLRTGGSDPLITRKLRSTDLTVMAGQIGTISVSLEANGDENAVGFSLSFDAKNLTYTGLSLSSGAARATLNINTDEISAGRLGVALALPSGTSFASGLDELVTVSFLAAPGAGGSYPMVFTDIPIFREFSDSAANELAADYFSGSVMVNPLPILRINHSGESVLLSWPRSATDFVLQQLDDLNPGTTWKPVSASATTTDTENVVTLPISGNNMLYRLYKQ